ncbi:MAG: tyrosine-type recombinase/integrase [bacterium]
MNRKLFTLRSYSKYLKLEQVPYVETLPFYDVLKCRQGYNNHANALSKQQVKSIFNAIDEEMNAILTQWIAVRKHLLNYDISNALFISKKGNRLAIRTIEDNFKKILKKLNVNSHIHPSEKKVRETLEKLPGVIYMNQLVESGLLKFQSTYHKRE